MKKKEFQEVIIELLRSINKRLADIENELKAPITMPEASMWPSTDDYPLRCPVCGVEMSNTMNYVCVRPDCPNFPQTTALLSTALDSAEPKSIEST